MKYQSIQPQSHRGMHPSRYLVLLKLKDKMFFTNQSLILFKNPTAVTARVV